MPEEQVEITGEDQLPYLSDEDRLAAVNSIIAGCNHLWSKGKLQEDKLDNVMGTFMNLAENDPHFLAHFTSYAMKRLDSKDLKVVATFANSLSDADGTPFSEGSKYKKPNLRVISQAAVQDGAFDAKLLLRLVEIANSKREMGNRPKATHFSRALKTAVRKYLRLRENNLQSLRGVRKVGLSGRYQNLYRHLHIQPSDDAAIALGWKQRGKDLDMGQSPMDFTGLSDEEIANKIREEKIKPQAAFGALGGAKKKISPVVAAGILEQCSGDEAVVLRQLFDSQGLLKHKEIENLFADKIKTAKTALDRVEKINTAIDEDVARVLKGAKAEKRKADMGTGIGSIFLHIDISISMQGAIDLAKDSGATIAECIPNPEENFYWGMFNNKAHLLPKPDSFEKDAFAARLFGIRANNRTEVMACWGEARRQGCDVDIFITDQGQNGPDAVGKIRRAIQAPANKPRAVVVVHGEGWQNYANRNRMMKPIFEAEGIPCTVIDPASLKESALVTQVIREAIKGPQAILDEIMGTELLRLPQWWGSVK